MIITVWPLVIAVVGLLLWALGSGKAAEVGRVLFIVGTFFTVQSMAQKTVKIGALAGEARRVA